MNINRRNRFGHRPDVAACVDHAEEGALNTKVLAIAAMLTVALPAQAEYPQRVEAQKLLDAYLQTHTEKDVASAAESAEVRSQTRICSYCHGEDGNSRHSEIPSLAGQKPRYIIEQFLIFKQQERYPNIMHNYSKKMTPETMVGVAMHFAALPRKPVGDINASRAAEGAELYQNLCANCHGADGKGANDTYSSIQAQWPAYIELTLKRYRDASSERHNHEMQVAVRGLTDREIQALAQYVASL